MSDISEDAARMGESRRVITVSFPTWAKRYVPGSMTSLSAYPDGIVPWVDDLGTKVNVFVNVASLWHL